MRLSAAAALREDIDSRKRELAATWADPDVRFGRYTGDAEVDPRSPVVVVESSALPHGLTKYQKDYCRCSVCTEARREYDRARKPKRDITHGLTRYTKHGCRCEICRDARKVYLASHRVSAYRSPGVPPNPHCKRSTDAKHSWYPCGLGMMRCRHCLHNRKLVEAELRGVAA